MSLYLGCVATRARLNLATQLAAAWEGLLSLPPLCAALSVQLPPVYYILSYIIFEPLMAPECVYTQRHGRCCSSVCAGAGCEALWLSGISW